MKTQVQKWGNSLAVRIPRAFAAEIGLEQNSPVDLSVESGKLVLEAIATPEYSLSDMLSLVTDENIHREIESGPSVGGEAW
jgi:antitoxin MazE